MSNTTRADRTAKVMSSRLLNMKFMQRTASPGQISNARPHSGQHTEQFDTKHPRSKRRKLGAQDQRLDEPEDPHIPDESDRHEPDLQASPSQPPDKTTELKWILGVPGVNGSGAGNAGQTTFQVSSTGFSDIDSRFVPTPTEGRRSFGNFNRQIEHQQRRSRACQPDHSKSTQSSKSVDHAGLSRSESISSSGSDQSHRTKSGQESLGSFT